MYCGIMQQYCNAYSYQEFINGQDGQKNMKYNWQIIAFDSKMNQFDKKIESNYICT